MRQILLTIFLISSCSTPTTYRPSIYGHDYVNSEIVTPITHERISCGASEFNRYASVSLEDLTNLALVLKYSDVPPEVRIIIEGFTNEVDNLVEEFDEN